VTSHNWRRLAPAAGWSGLLAGAAAGAAIGFSGGALSMAGIAGCGLTMVGMVAALGLEQLGLQALERELDAEAKERELRHLKEKRVPGPWGD